MKRAGYTRYAALQALAIREKKIHVYGTPDLPRKPVQIFLDAEGSEDGSFVYLLGVLVVEGDSQKMHSFWADGPDQEVQVFDAFLDLLDGHEDFALFHYGSYEKTLLKRMRKVVKRKKLVDRALAKAVNVLSVIHASVYFPTFSNGLKDVGRYLGCTWTDENASGLPEPGVAGTLGADREPVWKEKLLTYNAEDCAALKKVTEFVQAVGEAARSRGAEATSAPAVPGRRLGGRGRSPVEPPGVVPRQVRPPGLRPRQPLCLLRLPTGEGLPPHQQGGQEGLPEPPQAEEAAEAARQQGGRDQERHLPLLQGEPDHPARQRRRTPSSPTT